MIKLNNKEYSGSVLLHDEERLVVSINTADRFEDVAQSICNVTSVTEIFANGSEDTHVVTAPVAAKIVAKSVYSLEFSTKPTKTQALENKIAEQNAIIESLSSDLDSMLIAMLEVKQ